MKAATGRCEGRKLHGTRDGEMVVFERVPPLRASGSPYRGIAAALRGEGVPTRTAGDILPDSYTVQNNRHSRRCHL
jgi:hypothetical protein